MRADAPDEAPKLIPTIIHQTYKSAKVPPAVRPFMQVRMFFYRWHAGRYAFLFLFMTPPVLRCYACSRGDFDGTGV